MSKTIRITKHCGRLLMLAAFIFLLVPGGLGWAESPAGRTAPTESFAVGMRDEPTGLDPALVSDVTSMFVTNQVYDTLVRYAPGGSMLVPGLAQSWSVSPDSMTWTFNVRPGVQFHDGTILDAAAVLYNFDRWWDPDHPYHNGSFEFFAALFGGFKGEPGCLISGLSTNGSQQFLLQLTEPFNPLPSLLTMPVFAIASPTAIQGGSLSTSPVGSGPFRFGEWVSGDHVQLDANPAYWGGQPSLDNLTFEILLDDAARYTALQGNAIQAAMNLPESYAITATLDTNLRIYWRPSSGIGYLGINRGHTPLGNPLVRQAIAHAINTPQLLADAYGPGHQPADQFLPPEVRGYNPAAPSYNYDPTLAQSLLAQAGYPGGVGLPPFTLAYRSNVKPYLPDPLAAAEAIHDDLLAVGINAVVTEYSSGEFITKYQNGELDLFLLGWTADYLHPDNFFAPHFCNTSNLGFGPQDATLCSQVDEARSDPDIADQLSLYQSASARVMETLPTVPLAHPTPLLVTRRNVAGLFPSPQGFDWYGRVFFASDWIYMPIVRR